MMIKSTINNYPYNQAWLEHIQKHSHGISISMGTVFWWQTDYIKVYSVKNPIELDHKHQRIEYVIKHNFITKEVLQIELKYICELLSNSYSKNLVCDYIPVIHADFNGILVVETEPDNPW